MCASVVFAVFCALLRWLCRLDGRLVRAAATIVGVFAVASSIGYDPEFVTDLFGAFVLMFLLFCVSHHLLSGRVRHPPVAHIPLGVCYVFFGAVFATVMLLGTGNVGMLTSVLDILLIEGSIRQALGSEYAKLSAEYARQVDTIGTLRESLLASCIEFTALCRTRNGGMGRPLRPLSDYLAVHRDIGWKETRLDLVYHLYQLKDLKVVWLQQRIDSVRKAVNANTDNIRDLKDEIQAMRSRIVDFRVKFSEQQRQFQLRQVSRKKPDPRSFFESWKQRARPVAALIRSDRVPESQWCRQAAGFPPRAPREEWVLPLHAAAAAAEASRQQVVLQPELPPALPQLWFMPALDAQSFQESAEEVLVPSFAPASEAVFDSPLSLVQPPIEDCLMLDSLSGSVKNLYTDLEAGSASASVDKDHRFAGTENLSGSLRRPTAQFFAPSPSFAFAPEASTRASATSVAPPPLAPTPAPALAFASAPTVVASSLAPTSTPAPATTDSVLPSAFLPLRTLSNVVEPQNQVTVASPPPKTPSNAARQQGTPPAPLKTKALVDHSIESKSEEGGKTLGPNLNGLFSGGNGGTTIATSFTFRSAVAAADVLTPAPLLPQTLSNVAGPQNTGTVAPSSLQTASNATEQQGAPARTDRPMIAPRSRRSAKTSSSAGNAVAGPSGSAAKTAAPLAMSPSPAIGGSSSMGAQLADPAPAATTAPSSSAAGVPSDPKGKGKAKAPEAPVVDDQSPVSLPKWPMTGKAYRELMNEVIEAVKLKMMGGQVKKTMDTDIRPIQLLAINSEDKVNAEVKDILEKDYIPDSKACADKVARFFYSPNGELMRNVDHDLKRNRLPSYYEAIQFAVLSEIRKMLAGHGIELPQEVWVSGYKHKISGESLVDILEELIDKVSTRMESKNESTLLAKFKDNAKTDLVDQVDFSIMMEHDEAADWAAMFLYDRSGWLIENIETRLPGLYKSEMLQKEVLKMVRQIFAARDVFFPESVTIEGYL